MNLYLTHRCNRGCPFCFARKVLQEAGNDLGEILTIKEIEMLLDRFPEIESVEKNVGLLGGEPFLYPHFGELLSILSSRGISAKIFTSATNEMPEVLKSMSIEDAIGKVNFVVNVGTKNTYGEKQFRNLDLFLKQFSPLVSLSFTIFDLSIDPTYLFDLIDEYGLNRNIRVGIALPILSGGNQYIALDDYNKAGAYFLTVAEQAAKRGITLAMDCGFIACMFSDEQIGKLLRLGTCVRFVCGAAIDVGPKLWAWNCFPLFQIGRVDVMNAKTLGELEKKLRESTIKYLGTSSGVFSKCKECRMMQKRLCEGGCLSFKSIK